MLGCLRDVELLQKLGHVVADIVSLSPLRRMLFFAQSSPKRCLTLSCHAKGISQTQSKELDLRKLELKVGLELGASPAPKIGGVLELSFIGSFALRSPDSFVLQF